MSYSIWSTDSSRERLSSSLSPFARFAIALRSFGSSPRRKFLPRRISALIAASAARFVSDLAPSLFSFKSSRCRRIEANICVNPSVFPPAKPPPGGTGAISTSGR